MYYDLCINYDNQKNFELDQYNNFCELIVSAMTDNYKILAINTNKKGVVSNSEICSYKEIDLGLVYKNYSIKFLNSTPYSEIDFKSYQQLKRLTVEISDSKELFQFSNPNLALKSYDIIAIKPKNEAMLEATCDKLSNFDIISIPYDEKINFNLKKKIIRSAIDNGVFFEICYSDFIKDNTKRSNFIANVLSILDVTKGKNLILSSGSDNLLFHRSPYDMISIFQTIFNFKAAQDLVSKNCEKLYLKSIQRKYFKTVIMLNEEKTLEQKEDKMIVEENK